MWNADTLNSTCGPRTWIVSGAFRIAGTPPRRAVHSASQRSHAQASPSACHHGRRSEIPALAVYRAVRQAWVFTMKVLRIPHIEKGKL